MKLQIYDKYSILYGGNMYQKIEVVLANNKSVKDVGIEVEKFNELTESIWRIFLESFQNSPTNNGDKILSIKVNTFEVI